MPPKKQGTGRTSSPEIKRSNNKLTPKALPPTTRSRANSIVVDEQTIPTDFSTNNPTNLSNKEAGEALSTPPRDEETIDFSEFCKTFESVPENDKPISGASINELMASFNELMQHHMKTFYKQFVAENRKLKSEINEKMNHIVEAKISEKLDPITKQLQEDLKAKDEEIQSLKDINTNIKVTLACVSDKLSHIEKIQLESETKGREYNIRISNADKNNETTDSATKHVFNILKLLGIKTARREDFQAIYFTGQPYGQEHSKRDIIAKVYDLEFKQTILRSVTKRRADLKQSGYYISNDYPHPVKIARRPLSQLMQAAHQAGEKSVKPKFDSIKIGNTEHCLFNLSTLPERVLQHYGSFNEKRSPDNSIVHFFGKKTPLSNHFPISLEINGHKYNSSEQLFFMYEMAMAEDSEGFAHVYNTTDPGQIKQYCEKRLKTRSQQLKEKWNEAKITMMEKALACKFSNSKMRQYLLSTSKATLIESSADKFWGSGITLANSNPTNEDIEGENHLGRLLVKIRSSLSNREPLSTRDPFNMWSDI